MESPITQIKSWQGVGGGPKAVEMSENEVKLMAMFMCPVAEIAMFYGFSERQLYRRFAGEPKLRLAFDMGRAAGKRALRLKQFTVAVTDGDVSMLRWLGQNILGQSNKHTMTVDELNPVALEDALDVEFKEIFEEIEAELKADGHLIAHKVDGAGAGPPVENEGQGKVDAPSSTSEAKIPS